ncbi:MAG: hypothetical protein KDD69_14770 [Bdellovibrionales bacterium]|nr:hypothetical protein [Bdellovibrionales bacterium]
MSRRLAHGGVYRLLLLLLVGLLLLGGAWGCFPMGLPEHFAGSGDGEAVPAALRFPRMAKLRSGAPQRFALVVLPPGQDELFGALKDDGPDTLGYQFLLGLIPFTRVYLQHGAQSFAHEVLVELLREQGYTPAVVAHADRIAAASALRPALVLSLEIEGTSLHAFDAFFFRVLSLESDLTLERFDSTGSTVVQTKHLTAEESLYRRFGYGPALAALLRQKLRSELTTALQAMAPPTASRAHPDATEPLVLVMLPALASTAGETLGQALADSYGYPNSEPYDSFAVRRILQRAIAASLREAGLRAVALADTSKAFRGAHESRQTVWQLAVDAVQVITDEQEAVPGMVLRMMFTLSDVSSPHPVLLERLSCGIDDFELAESDGYRVVTLERAVHAVTKHYIAGQKDQGGSARCVSRRYAAGSDGHL